MEATDLLQKLSYINDPEMLKHIYGYKVEALKEYRELINEAKDEYRIGKLDPASI